MLTQVVTVASRVTFVVVISAYDSHVVVTFTEKMLSFLVEDRSPDEEQLGSFSFTSVTFTVVFMIEQFLAKNSQNSSHTSQSKILIKNCCWMRENNALHTIIRMVTVIHWYWERSETHFNCREAEDRTGVIVTSPPEGAMGCLPFQSCLGAEARLIN